MATLKQTNFYFFFSCIVGVTLSCYALMVELKFEKNEDYSAYCDVNEYISCTKAFSSQYGKGFGVIGKIFGNESIFNQPNSIGGILFYLLMALTSFNNTKAVINFQIFWCVISNFLSLYLAYILYFILKDFCIVCVSTYIINALNLILLLLKKHILQQNFSLQAKKAELKNK